MKDMVTRWVRPVGILAGLVLAAVIAMSIMPGGAQPTLLADSQVEDPTTTTEALEDPTPPSTIAPVTPGEKSAGGVREALLPLEVLPESAWAVSVATARADVRIPAMFDAPDGEPVSFSDPVSNPTYFGTALALLVMATDADWLQVQLPVRPNGTTAWVNIDEFAVSTHAFHAEVQLSKHRLRVWEDENLIVDTSTVVGTEATPTPIGRFYVNDLVPAENTGGSYGPWILSLSAHSEVLDTFIDGRPVIAIHGTNRPDLLGTDSSNGCIRIPNDLVELLATTVPLGTPVDILA
jgi:hypothetical protein